MQLLVTQHTQWYP